MKNLKIEKIIVKYINQEANSNELTILESWLKEDTNKKIFNDFVQVEYLTSINMKQYDLEKAKHIIKNKSKVKKKKHINSLLKKFSVAASIIILLGVSFFQYMIYNTTKDATSIAKNIVIGSSKAILTLQNGEQVALKKDKEYTNEEVRSNGKELIYGQVHAPTHKTVYNYLTIPRGGEYIVHLSDGTKVFLNSDSQLKYPVTFMQGATRKVELMYGEAYFEVSPSSKHQGDSFDVITKNQELNVLGTHFNIKAYPEDAVISTTLIEGKVSISNGINAKFLKPNQQSRIIQNSNSIDVSAVDVSHEVAWIRGMFSFNEESLENMMEVLSRWYDVEVVFESSEKRNFEFTGILEKTKSIEDILKLISATSGGDIEFKVNKKKITVQ
jgi:transmembrane sensor